ncbi:B3 domain-containing transcription factor VAL3-like isoform X2 [Ipomoea triloba]|uniref:B3 domain-containing transcription factor VAL3-like isoform X2 n=1 Tax=Ipomoea triloba TaxID=35885 RepID=UPI00125DDB0A|nr:B3 domain-containing transcription factor VAL3-like isoform X2 [Ipomoea triloba]
MASSSRKTCLQCQASSSSSSSSSDGFRNGWRIRSGEFAQLCRRCASAYDEGKFCETFHSNDDGWRDCEGCGKLVHCGCIVSFNTYLLLDFGGIMCMECSKISFILARNCCMYPASPLPFDDPQQDPSRKNQKESQYCPHANGPELQQIYTIPGSIGTPLFEKVLSATDTDLKLSRLFIPKTYAETFFPDLCGRHGMPISILDTEGKQWEFFIRCWPNPSSKTYVLEGLRDYIIAKKWQAGDIVTFCQTKPGGKLMMGLRKTSTGSASS